MPTETETKGLPAFEAGETAETATDPKSEAASYLDAAGFDRLWTERMGQFERRLQSQLDRRDGNIQRRFRELRGAGERTVTIAKSLGLPDDQVKALARALQEDAMTAALGAEVPSPQLQVDQLTPDTGHGTPDTVDATNARGMRLAAKYGLEVGDPEVAAIKIDGTPDEYLESIVEAGVAKRQRLAGERPEAEVQPNAARMPAVSPAGTRPREDMSKMSTRQLAERAAEQIRRAAGS